MKIGVNSFSNRYFLGRYRPRGMHQLKKQHRVRGLYPFHTFNTILWENYET